MHLLAFPFWRRHWLLHSTTPHCLGNFLKYLEHVIYSTILGIPWNHGCAIHHISFRHFLKHTATILYTSTFFVHSYKGIMYSNMWIKEIFNHKGMYLPPLLCIFKDNKSTQNCDEGRMPRIHSFPLHLCKAHYGLFTFPILHRSCNHFSPRNWVPFRNSVKHSHASSIIPFWAFPTLVSVQDTTFS